MTTVVAWDLETTGRLRAASDHWLGQPGIVQIGAIKLQLQRPSVDIHDRIVTQMGVGMEWVEAGRLNMLIDPEFPDDAWDTGAIEVTGIGPEQVRGKPSLLVAHEEIAEFFRGADYSLGYNLIHFDYPVLEHQLRRYNLQRHFPWPPKDIDLMRFSTQWCDIAGKRGTKRPTLGELHEAVIGADIKDAHDAINDVQACVDIFIAKGGLAGVGIG